MDYFIRLSKEGNGEEREFSRAILTIYNSRFDFDEQTADDVFDDFLYEMFLLGAFDYTFFIQNRDEILKVIYDCHNYGLDVALSDTSFDPCMIRFMKLYCSLKILKVI